MMSPCLLDSLYRLIEVFCGLKLLLLTLYVVWMHAFHPDLLFQLRDADSSKNEQNLRFCSSAYLEPHAAPNYMESSRPHVVEVHLVKGSMAKVEGEMRTAGISLKT